MPYSPTQQRHALRLARSNGVAYAARETGIDSRSIKRWIKAEEKERAEAEPVEMPPPELTAVADLTPHPRNYRDHPEDQIDHIVQSIRDYGVYRNVVTANDGTILAGHGVLLAAKRLNLEEIPAIRLDIDPDSPAALKLLAADNYLSHFAVDDDRALTELLGDVATLDDLFGTGFDEQSLSALLMVTRDASEIADFDAAAEWVGMPDYEHGKEAIAVNIQFDNDADRLDFIDKHELEVSMKRQKTWTIWWPPRNRDDVSSLKWDDG